MIKKAGLILLLMVIGFVLVNLLIDPIEPRAQPQKESEIDRRDQPSIKVPAKDGKNTSIVVRPQGATRFSRTEQIEIPGGYRLMPLYTLTAEDSRSEPGNRVALTGVTVDFFKPDLSDPRNPKPIRTATMAAAKALIELSRDENQVSQLAEDKLMEFWDVVYTTGAEGSMRNTTIEIGHAQAVNTADMVHLWTPDKTEPIRIESRGKDSFLVTGNGLDAWIPTSRDEKGNVEMKTAGVREVTVLSQPTLVSGETTLASQGPLELKEVRSTSSIRATMRDAVRIETRRVPKPGTKDPRVRLLAATGESLVAILSVTDTDNLEKSFWQRVELRGSPAEFSDAGNLSLRCQHLSVLPDSSGAPFWVTASGAPRVTHVVEGQENTYRSAGDVHVVQIGKQHDFLLRSFGLAGGIPTDFDQLVLFEGRSEFDARQDKLHVVAEQGLTLLRSSLPALRDKVIAYGRGAIEVRSDQIVAQGNRGFLLRQWPLGLGEDATIQRTFRLGPASPDTGHRYDLLRLADRKAKPGTPGAEPLRLIGSGFCSVRIRGEHAEEFHASSLAEDIDLRLGASSGHLWQLRTLDVWLATDGRPVSVIAKGQECRVEATTERGLLEGQATEIYHPTLDTYRLVGKPAETKSSQYGTLRGRDILIQRIDADIRLRATENAVLKLDQLPADVVARRPNGQILAARFEIRSDLIRVEPMLIPPSQRALHGSRVPMHLDTYAGRRSLFADGHVRFEYDVTLTGGSHLAGLGTGDHLRLRTDRSGRTFTDGTISGDPAKIDSVEKDGRSTSAASAAIAFHLDASGETITLEPSALRTPVLRLLGLPGGSGQPENIQLSSQGRIVVEPRQIRCLAPVLVQALDLRGEVDPTGQRLDARSATIARSPKGEITGMSARGDVDFRWLDAAGTCDEFELDLGQTMLTARGIERPADVQLPSGRLRLGQVNYNYRTKMFRVWKGLVLTRR